MEGIFSSGSTSKNGLSWETSSSEVKGQGGRAMVYLYGMFVLFYVSVELMLDINNLDGEMDDLKSICSNAVSVKAYHLRSTGQESKSTCSNKDQTGLMYSIKTHFPLELREGVCDNDPRTFNIIPQYPS
jgi:hypothetical protein